MFGRLFNSLFGKRTASAGSGIGERAANDAVRRQLRVHGDDGRLPRHVLHFAYPDKSANPATAAAMEQLLRGFALTVRPASQDGGLVAEHQSAVAGASFDELTSTIASALRAAGWTYDGWECAVVSKESGT